MKLNSRYTLSAAAILLLTQTANLHALTFPYSNSVSTSVNRMQPNTNSGTSFNQRIDSSTFAPNASATAYTDGYQVGSSANVSSAMVPYEKIPAQQALSVSNLNNGLELQEYDLFRSSSANGNAGFSQTFLVTGAGQATLNFSWDGTLFSASDDASAGYNFRASLRNGTGVEPNIFEVNRNFLIETPRLNLPKGIFDNRSISNGSSNIDEQRSLTLNFDSDDVGGVFTLNLNLDTFANASFGNSTLYAATRSLTPNEERIAPSLAFANFSNTAIFSFSSNGQNGGLSVIAPAPVPVPGAIWLLGSALFGLVSMRRRKQAV